MKTIMIQGTSSGAGKSTLVAALCRIFSDRGVRVAPFKSQNMSCFSYKGHDFEISRAQAVQAIAARIEPAPELNPIMLKPQGGDSSVVYVDGKRYKKMRAVQYYTKFAQIRGLDAVMSAYKKLEKNFDVLVIEGAGSPAEINLQRYDIANMGIAQRLKSPVILVTDIDRGGSFASLAGTLFLLNKKHQDLVRGFVFNKFRGDPKILYPGFAKLRRITKKPTLGVIPMTDINIPDEDSLDSNKKDFTWSASNIKDLDSAINKLGRLVQKSLNMQALERIVQC